MQKFEMIVKALPVHIFNRVRLHADRQRQDWHARVDAYEGAPEEWTEPAIFVMVNEPFSELTISTSTVWLTLGIDISDPKDWGSWIGVGWIELRLVAEDETLFIIEHWSWPTFDQWFEPLRAELLSLQPAETGADSEQRGKAVNNISGGVNVDANDITAGNDVVVGDKNIQAATYIEHYYDLNVNKLSQI